MNGMKDLLLEMLFIVLPIFIYQIFWVDNRRYIENKGILGTKLIVLLFTSIAIILCMVFPIHIFPGYLLDLRIVPFMIGVFYGGYRVGVALTAILLLYRFYLGGGGFYASLIVFLFALVVLAALVKYFRRVSKQTKILITVLLSTVLATLVTVMCFWFSFKLGYSLSLEKAVLSKFVFYILIHPVTGALAVFLIESLREKRFLQLEIQRMEKIEVLGDLATSVAHEIRNPLTVTRGFLQLLKVPAEQQPYVDLAVKEVDAVEAVISDYLYLTRPEAETLEIFEVEELVTHTMHRMEPYALAKKIELKISLIESGVTVESPRDKFGQLLTNLIKVGIESMPAGGCIEINVSKKNGQAVISIMDNGDGMTNEQILNFGLPFYSLKEDGTGLGLMFCYRFVQMLNGSIEIKSQKGKGTEFLLKIPISIQKLAMKVGN